MGPDGLNGQLLQGTARLSTPILIKIFNRSRRCKSFPQHWKLANVTPIYKKGNNYIQTPTKYRPVSLLCITSKVFEKLIFHRLNNHCMSNNLLTTKNSGFHKKSWNPQPANLPSTQWYRCRHGILLDQSCAFDHIWHKGLLHKLDAISLSTIC